MSLPYKHPTDWANNDFWIDLLKRNGALWRHDGNPKRPYVRQTNGQISDTYINFSRLPPTVVHQFMGYLAHLVRPRLHGGVAIIGQAESGIVLGYDLALQLQRRYGYTKKWRGKRILAPRCRTQLPKWTPLLLCDDVYRSGSTLNAARVGLTEAGYDELLPFDAVAIRRIETDRSSSRGIVSVATIESRSWNEGENPHTPDGQELVPSLRPKGRNWGKLTQNY